MTEFKKGDRVICTRSVGDALEGDFGVVTDRWVGAEPRYEIQFDRLVYELAMNTRDLTLAPPSSERTIDWAAERADVLARFSEELAKATGDGSKKRKAGTKPPWYIDQSHEGAIFSHLTKWKRGEKVDPDSGAHPLVHLAWRALAIACQENGNVP